MTKIRQDRFIEKCADLAAGNDNVMLAIVLTVDKEGGYNMCRYYVEDVPEGLMTIGLLSVAKKYFEKIEASTIERDDTGHE